MTEVVDLKSQSVGNIIQQGSTAGAPFCPIAFDKKNTAVLERCGIEDKLVKIQSYRRYM